VFLAYHKTKTKIVGYALVMHKAERGKFETFTLDINNFPSAKSSFKNQQIDLSQTTHLDSLKLK